MVDPDACSSYHILQFMVSLLEGGFFFLQSNFTRQLYEQTLLHKLVNLHFFFRISDAETLPQGASHQFRRFPVGAHLWVFLHSIDEACIWMATSTSNIMPPTMVFLIAINGHSVKRGAILHTEPWSTFFDLASQRSSSLSWYFISANGCGKMPPFSWYYSFDFLLATHHWFDTLHMHISCKKREGSSIQNGKYGTVLKIYLIVLRLF